MNKELRRFVKTRYEDAGFKKFNIFMKEYEEIKDFKISENIWDTGQKISKEAHYIMRLVAEYYYINFFKAMKIDMNDANVSGDKGTPYRVTKMYTGSNLEDDTELLCGRWSKPPRIASFPNTHHSKFPITKRIDVTAVCSHHTAPFSTKFREDSYAIVSYIPNEKVLGISKLQRVVDNISRRGHLQEELTQKIYEYVSEVAGTEDVYVKLNNLSHTCESLRGTQSSDGAFTSEYYGGAFKDPELRGQVQQ